MKTIKIEIKHKSKIKDFIFNSTNGQSWYFWVKEKIKIYIGTKTTFDFSATKKFLVFNVKDFIFYKHICNLYNLWFTKKYDLVIYLVT